MADFPVVGIGSSAGGLEALQVLFRALPADAGLGFIVAPHLDPTQKSHLTELLARCTEMPVVEIARPIEVERDHVYVIAPNQELTIRKGVIRSRRPTAPRGHWHPIDSFFRSLAEDQRERAIAIVLSGTGTNGSQGLRFVKAEGGIVMVQEPDTAAFAGMPRNAIATGVVDLVLTPDKMPRALLNLACHPYVRPAPEALDQQTPDEQLSSLLALLRTTQKRNFAGYKKWTLLRRVQRRMGLRRIDSLADYIERLRRDSDETRALVADLTVNVTGFFRDPQAWRVLGEQVLEPLIRTRPSELTLRVWVPGCSTGEEAYSIVMLIHEQAARARKIFEVKLFATDVAQSVLAAARAGTYPASIAQDVSPDRLQHWFKREDDTYSVSRTLRGAITFAPQNLLQDPPFSHLDLISCRNLLIYLEPDMQKRLMALFHFALREDGHLFLGSAETIAGQDAFFRAVSKKWRIYQRAGPTRSDVEFPLSGPSDPTVVGTTPAEAPRSPGLRASEIIERELLERYAPASALIDQHLRVHYLRGPTEDFLQPPSGEPSFNLIAMIRQGLQQPLRAAIRKASEQGQEVVADARVRRGVSLHPVRLVVIPLRSSRNADRLLVSFFDRAPTSPGVAAAKEEAPRGEDQLQAELDHAREDLRLTIEQMEGSNEELKASNEEIRSINEELQASNEELETSKEELQSLNEELNTVNSQLQAKVTELEDRTDDLNNLLNSTDVATLFLDRKLDIRWFTPAMKALLALLPTDIGRPVEHFAQRFSGGNLAADAREVLKRLQPSDVEVVDEQGRWYLRHIAPYRTAADLIDGVVVSFTGLTDHKLSERAREFAESIVDTVREPLLVLTPELRVRTANKAYYRVFQATREDTQDRPIFDLGNRQWDIAELRRMLEEVLPHDQQFSDFEVDHAFQTIGRRTMLLNGRRLELVQLILLAIEDVTERRRAERQRELLTRELGRRVKTTLAAVQALGAQTDGRGSVEDFRATFVGRLSALSRAQSLLLDAQWRGAELKALVEQAVAAARVDRPAAVEIEGGPAALSPNQGLGLSLILHELGSNAARHGALSNHEGRVRVFRAVEGADGGRQIRLRWEESGGPVVERPTLPGSARS